MLTPGIYDLTEPIRVTRPGTVVMGLGFATLHPTQGTAAMTTADVDGVEIAGLLFDAGPEKSPGTSRMGWARALTSIIDVAAGGEGIDWRLRCLCGG